MSEYDVYTVYCIDCKKYYDYKNYHNMYCSFKKHIKSKLHNKNVSENTSEFNVDNVSDINRVFTYKLI